MATSAIRLQEPQTASITPGEVSYRVCSNPPPPRFRLLAPERERAKTQRPTATGFVGVIRDLWNLAPRFYGSPLAAIRSTGLTSMNSNSLTPHQTTTTTAATTTDEPLPDRAKAQRESTSSLNPAVLTEGATP